MSALGRGKQRFLGILLVVVGIGGGVVAYDLVASAQMAGQSDCNELATIVKPYLAEIDRFRGHNPENWYDAANLYDKLALELDRFVPDSDAMRDAGTQLRENLTGFAIAIHRFNPSTANRERFDARAAALRDRLRGFAEQCRE